MLKNIIEIYAKFNIIIIVKEREFFFDTCETKFLIYFF